MNLPSDDQSSKSMKSRKSIAQIGKTVSGEYSPEKKKQIQQKIYLILNDYECNRLAFFLSILSIFIISLDIILLILETEKELGIIDIWVAANSGVSGYFVVEYAFRAATYNAFEESLIEFFKSNFVTNKEPFNLVDILALVYSIIEQILYLIDVQVDPRIKVLRMLIVLRLIRIFKFSTFSLGVKQILIRGLSESMQALSLLLFFTMICVILISSFMYFAEKEFVDDSQIQNIPQAIWWAIITITTVGYGDYVPKSLLGKFIGVLSLIFGVLLLSLPVAIIGNKFQEIYLQNKKEETKKARKNAKTHYNQIQNQNEKEIYRIILKLNELEQVNERIEQCLKDNQFLYRSISRDAQSMIDKIEINRENGKSKSKQKERMSTQERIIKIREEILNRRKNQ
ncbi:unnamed protein product (macronuclear) [Paramecium tetraurelia]|uniref:Ion transport domain-containing protein n=1 Tax=Paramecium tetraurelia TaxID=5888 RepID=A0CJN3_PARTE|nr:uncharacterized protein GSPATT00000712001 [Paramecium tetraurelia]CAK71000.1 unnamed protein product [Paramecium tetraurelia]|eukprot:XP_001438397.1 hypothetical protein (macronuclear) [Paramecium tetraurelia strain d4-2]